jgi:FkbM family methyltransferase
MNAINFNSKTVHQFKNSPHGEQSMISEFFQNSKKGYYVDVGANHPTIESQSWHLEQLGWHGLLLDPLPGYCQLLKEKRSGTVVQFACSSPENHNKILKLINAGGHSTLNTNPIALGDNSCETIDVTCKTLDSILTEYGAPIGFDFISIDIEGHEMEMFKGFTLDKWKPKLVLLEDHVINHQKHHHMITNGYQLILRTGLNSWYVPASEHYHFSLRARFQIFRKYWLGLIFRKYRYSRS